MAVAAKALSGAERLKRPAEDAGHAHGLKCVTQNAKGKAWWGPWGAPDEYVYGADSKFVLPTGSVKDSDWVQDINWKGRVSHEDLIAKKKALDMKAGADEDKMQYMRDFLRYRGEDRDPWQTVHQSHGLDYATPARCVRPPTAQQDTKWLLDIQGPMRSTLNQAVALRRSTLPSGVGMSQLTPQSTPQSMRSRRSGQGLRSVSGPPGLPFPLRRHAPAISLLPSARSQVYDFLLHTLIIFHLISIVSPALYCKRVACLPYYMYYKHDVTCDCSDVANKISSVIMKQWASPSFHHGMGTLLTDETSIKSDFNSSGQAKYWNFKSPAYSF